MYDTCSLCSFTFYKRIGHVAFPAKLHLRPVFDNRKRFKQLNRLKIPILIVTRLEGVYLEHVRLLRRQFHYRCHDGTRISMVAVLSNGGYAIGIHARVVRLIKQTKTYNGAKSVQKIKAIFRKVSQHSGLATLCHYRFRLYGRTSRTGQLGKESLAAWLSVEMHQKEKKMRKYGLRGRENGKRNTGRKHSRKERMFKGGTTTVLRISGCARFAAPSGFLLPPDPSACIPHLVLSFPSTEASVSFVQDVWEYLQL